MAKGQNVGSSRNASDEDRLVIQEILSRPSSVQRQAADDHFQRLLKSACQPRHLSGNACVRLCYFLELCRKSDSVNLQRLVFSATTCLDLFHFHVEWNEKNQHRSMRQVLELFVTLIISNPDRSIAKAAKLQILQRLLLIINHQSIQSLVKPALKVLEFLLSKEAITADELSQAHGNSDYFRQVVQTTGNHPGRNHTAVRDSVVSAVFDWMSLPDTTSSAGRLLVTLFEAFRKNPFTNPSDSPGKSHTTSWKRWVRKGLTKHPGSLENIKNHLFPLLFKTDRAGAIAFLQDLSSIKTSGALAIGEFDAQAVIFLSVMEVGKKYGLVDEPGKIPRSSFTEVTHDKDIKPLGFTNSGNISLPENMIGGFLTHNTSILRSLAFSVLVSSRSPISPFTSYTLRLLKSNLMILHADTDAKFRNEVLSSTKHMLERLKGAISSLNRALFITAAPSSEDLITEHRNPKISEFESPSQEILKSFQEHKDFIKWYQSFLERELIPTASYQRHITALRALQLAISSEVFTHKKDPDLKGPLYDTDEWPFALIAFTKPTMRLLLDLLMDPFEDVRNTAGELLRLAPESCFLDWKYVEERKGDLEIGLNPHIGIVGARKKRQHADYFVNGDEGKATLQEPFCNLIKCFAEHAEAAATRTGRADFADGVSKANELRCRLAMNGKHSYSFLSDLICDLESRVVRAEQNLAEAVLTTPIHGQFASVRLVYDIVGQSLERIAQPDTGTAQAAPFPVSEFRALECRMVRCCSRIWQAVREILCSDSPEGHLPKDIEDIEMLDTKGILSYSFRAIYESSNLLRAMASKARRLFKDRTPMLPVETFCEAGYLTFNQLSNLRHRGVFSTVSLTFGIYCQISNQMSVLGASGKPLTEEWYMATLKCISEQTSTTRRSAGIPALITGILSTYSSSPPIEEVMNLLKEIARKPILLAEKEETALEQVHAFNSLKEIFKSSTLGRRCEGHIADCLKLAAESLQSKVWAIRNCALLLLRSLIDCLFSTSENKMIAEAGWDGKSVRLSYERYPTLPELLLQLLDTNLAEHSAVGPDTGRVESVFPALDIIRRAGPPRRLQKEIYDSVAVHLGSAVWNIREIAAQTICTLLLGNHWQLEVSKLLEVANNSANRVHGTLLAIKLLMEKRMELGLVMSSDNLSAIIWTMKRFWDLEAPWKACPLVEAAFEEVMTNLLRNGYFKLNFGHVEGQDIRSWGFGTAFLVQEIVDKANHLLQACHYSLEKTKIHPGNDGLLIRATTIRALHAAAFGGELDLAFQLIIFATQTDVDIAILILEYVPQIWGMRSTPPDILMSLVGVYTRIVARTSSSCIRSKTLSNLADVVDSLSERGTIDPEIGMKLCQLGISLFSSSPDLSKSEIRISGSILAQDFALGISSPGVIDEKVRAWGDMLIACGNDLNDFGVRHAAVATLRAFYGTIGLKLSMEDIVMVKSSARCCFLPSLLALYDTLNDDDDEIRNAAAAVVCHILGTYWVPLAASREFLVWLERIFGETEVFCNIVLQRVTGDNSASLVQIMSVKEQLATAMVDDDSLFIEEEQNLYRDPVREAFAWTSVLLNARGTHWEDARNQLLSWALEGLGILEQLAMTEGGPYGWWTSKPKVFAICMTIQLTTNTLLGYRNVLYLGQIRPTDANNGKAVTKQTGFEVAQYREDLQAVLKSLLDTGLKNRLHPLILNGLRAIED